MNCSVHIVRFAGKRGCCDQKACARRAGSPMKLQVPCAARHFSFQDCRPVGLVALTAVHYDA